MTINKTTLAAVVAAIAMAGCGGADSQPGNPAVYKRIKAETNCTALQGEFDVAMRQVDARKPGDAHRDMSLSYAEAADKRMRSIGCYGK
jgi:hypothetical protein